MRLKTAPFLIALVALSLGLVAMALPEGTRVSMAAFSLGSGVVALVLMAFASVLGARWKVVESAFGGLDRVYEIHNWLGVWALVFASVHLVFKAGMPGWDTAAIIELPSFLVRLVRQLSFVALMLIVLLALNRRIPYRTWRWWHKLSGPLFLVVVRHWLSFKTPIVLVSPAGLWLAFASALGRLVAKVAAGMTAVVRAPFGRFARPAQAGREVWVAGGVGISPFIAWMDDRAGVYFERVTLFNFQAPGREFPALGEVGSVARRRGVQYVPMSMGAQAPAFQDRFAQLVDDAGPAAVQVCFCGPRGLLDQVRAAMAGHGVPEANLRYEHFDFR